MPIIFRLKVFQPYLNLKFVRIFEEDNFARGHASNLYCRCEVSPTKWMYQAYTNVDLISAVRSCPFTADGSTSLGECFSSQDSLAILLLQVSIDEAVILNFIKAILHQLLFCDSLMTLEHKLIQEIVAKICL